MPVYLNMSSTNLHCIKMSNYYGLQIPSMGCSKEELTRSAVKLIRRVIRSRVAKLDELLNENRSPSRPSCESRGRNLMVNKKQSAQRQLLGYVAIVYYVSPFLCPCLLREFFSFVRCLCKASLTPVASPRPRARDLRRICCSSPRTQINIRAPFSCEQYSIKMPPCLVF